MISRKVKFLSLFFMAALVFQSCSKDDDIVDEGFVDTQALRGPGGNNNGQDGGRGGDDDDDVFDFSSDNAVVKEWTDVFLEVERYALGMRPNASARAMAYIYLASYETAAPAMTEYGSIADDLQGLRIDEDRAENIDVELALNEAFATTLDHFLINTPSNIKAKIEELEDELEDELSEGLPQNVINDSEEWGRYVAEQVIEYSQTDRQAEQQIRDPQPRSYEPPTGDGYWTYSADPERALFPYWGSVRTFVISPEETSTVEPITYSNAEGSEYFAQMKEVYEVNNEAKANQGEQLWIAEFWSDDVEELMFSPPARQYSIANQLVEQYDLNLEETLALYLKLGFSLNDAAVATWKYKYQYMVMRPNVFIHDYMDAEFQTNLYRLVYWPNPSFPGYPSGHSCFASAAAGVFIDAFGNNTNFTDRSHEGRTEFLGAPRTFSTFEHMAEENAYSRIPLGVHIRMDCDEGLRLGYEISEAVNAFNINRDPS